MICTSCQNSEGSYSEIEDFNPGNEPEWSNYLSWQCFSCDHTVYSYDDGFVYGDEE